MTPENEWVALMGRVTDLAVDAFYLKKRLDSSGSGDGFRSVFMAEQLDKGKQLRDDLTAFVKARLEAAKPAAPHQGVKR